MIQNKKVLKSGFPYIYMKNNKKGLSPVIATVLLIAMVVVIAVIIFLWLRSMTQETITKFEGENVELTCDRVEFEATYLDGILDIANTGNVPIFSMKVEINKGEAGFETKDITELSSMWPPNGLNQGGIFSGSVSLDSGVEKIILYPVLLGTSDEGQKTYFCDKDSNGVEISLIAG